MAKLLVKGFITHNQDYTENLFYVHNDVVYGCFNVSCPNNTMWPKGKTYVQCAKPDTWEFIGNYDLNEKSK